MSYQETKGNILTRILKSVLLLVSFLGIIFLWYGRTEIRVMMGDDLLYLYSELDGKSFWEAVLNINQVLGKYRPILFAVLYWPCRLFGTRYELYYYFNIVLFSLCCVTIYYFARFISKNIISAFVVSCLFITSPFSAYYIGQVFGTMEILAIIFEIVTIYGCIMLFRTRQMNYVAIICIGFFLSMFDTERMMYLYPCIVLVILMTLIEWKKKIVSLLVALLPLIFKFMISNLNKVSMLETGRGSALSLLSTIVPLYLKGIVNTLGFSLGDQWHGGFEILTLPRGVCEISAINVVLLYFMGLIGVLYAYRKYLEIKVKGKKAFWQFFYDGTLRIGELLILLIFACAAVVPYALVAKTHGEDRFLSQPYLLILFVIIFLIHMIPKKKWLYGMVVVMCLCRFSTDVIYKDNKEGVHWKYSLKEAQTIYEAVNNSLVDAQGKDIYVMYATNDFTWIMGDQLFSKYYINPEANTYYVASVDELPLDARNDDKALFLVPSKNKAYTVECISYEELLEYSKD